MNARDHPAYRRSLAELLECLPAHTTPQLVQSLAEQAAEPPGDFSCELPQTYALFVKWLTFERVAQQWDGRRVAAFYDWCKRSALRHKRLVEMNAIRLEEGTQTALHAARAIRALCRDYLQHEQQPGADRRLRARREKVAHV